MPPTIDKTTIFFAIIIAAIIILSAFLFNATGISISSLLDLQNWRTMISKFLSAEFIATLIVLPLAYAFGIIAMKKNEAMETFLACSFSAAIATIISIIIFPNLLYYWIIAIFFIFSFPVAIYYSTISFKELKKFIVFRGINSSIHKGSLLFLFGLIVFSAATLMPKTQQLATEFEHGMIGIVLGQNLSGVQSLDFSEQAADSFIQSQIELLNQMTENELFQKLRAKTDPDVIAAVAIVDQKKQQLQSPEYKEQVKQQIKASQGNAIQKAGLDETQLLKTMRTQFPIVQQFENWFWLITAITLIGIVQLIIAIIIAPLGAIYGLLLDKLSSEEAKATNN